MNLKPDKHTLIKVEIYIQMKNYSKKRQNIPKNVRNRISIEN